MKDEYRGNFLQPGQTLSFGVPQSLNINSHCLGSLSPGNIGSPNSSSAIIVLNCYTTLFFYPIDQTSTCVEYFFEPNSNSGALYHNVTTQDV
jgi:hypothetical protein